jgi:hypothetical protein
MASPEPVRDRSPNRSDRLRVNVPQRIDPPRDIKTPRRSVEFDSVPRSSSPIRVSATGGPSGLPTTPTSGIGVRKSLDSQLKDFATLAFACKRAGKLREEGLAYHNMGVVCDNKGDFSQAVQHYTKYVFSCIGSFVPPPPQQPPRAVRLTPSPSLLRFLEIARARKDPKSEAIALNAIGIDFQKMGGVHLDDAIAFHQRHLDVADVPGKFVAHSNLGLCFAAQGDHERASVSHRSVQTVFFIVAFCLL